jgi:hypothetical protein
MKELDLRKSSHAHMTGRGRVGFKNKNCLWSDWKDENTFFIWMRNAMVAIVPLSSSTLTASSHTLTTPSFLL